MRPSDEIHHYPRMLQRILEHVASSAICEENKKTILRFHDRLIANGLSLARQTKYLTTVLLISKRLGKDFREVTREDIEQFIKSIELSAYTTWTKHDYKIIFKIFYRWLKDSRTYPDEIAWIKCKTGESRLLPEGLLSQEDIERLVQAAFTLRDRAFVLVLFDSGCRIGELLSLRIRGVSFDQYGAQLIVDGKTGRRRVRITASVPALSTWLDNHPFRADPDSPLWISLGTRDRGQMLAYRSAYSMIKKLAKKAGLAKRIYPHLFRHSRATMLAKHLVEPVFKEWGGWVQSSRASAGYVHLSGRDVDREILKLQGIIVDEKDQKNEFKVLNCVRCSKPNSPTSKFCNFCGMPLDVSSAARVDDLKQKADRLISALMTDEKILDKLLDKINELRSS